MNLFDSTIKSIQNSLFLKENENVFSKIFDNLTPDEKSKLISDLAKRSTNPNMPVSNPEILDKIHQTYTSTLAPSTSAAAVSKKEVTVPGGSASAPASYINTSVSTKL